MRGLLFYQPRSSVLVLRWRVEWTLRCKLNIPLNDSSSPPLPHPIAGFRGGKPRGARLALAQRSSCSAHPRIRRADWLPSYGEIRRGGSRGSSRGRVAQSISTASLTSVVQEVNRDPTLTSPRVVELLSPQPSSRRFPRRHSTTDGAFTERDRACRSFPCYCGIRRSHRPWSRQGAIGNLC